MLSAEQKCLLLYIDTCHTIVASTSVLGSDLNYKIVSEEHNTRDRSLFCQKHEAKSTIK